MMKLNVLCVALAAASAAGAEPPLKACATLSDLGSIVRHIGGAEVQVTTFAKGTEDAHFVEARPSFVKSLSVAELYIENGLEMEIGWAPVILRNARNGAVLAGAPGHLNASVAVTPKGVPVGAIDRSLGDVHPMGNPHYLSDPINGLKVAGLIRDRLSQLRPGSKAEFQKRYQEFHARIGAAMFGQELAGVYDPLKLAELADHGKLELFLQQQGQAGLLGGWAARFKPHRGARIVADHNMWVYLTDRCGVQVAGFMEPKPGLSPTTAHLAWVVEQMKQSGVRVVITGAYFDPKHARFLAQQTGAKTVVLAHQAGALPGTEDYLSMIEHNMSALAAALNGGP